jgi:hypothetical protein
MNTVMPPSSALSPQKKKQVSASSAHEKKQRAKAAKSLANARQRCTNPKNKDYAAYGGQGIKVLLTLDELIAAIGLPAPNASLDRIDPHGHYEAGNVRWASKAVQAANKKASPAGSAPSLSFLIKQQKFVVQQEQLRPKVAEAWQLLLMAFNRGALSKTDDALLMEMLGLEQSAQATFRSREVQTAEQTQVIFRLPSLTLPNAIVDARGPIRAAPDGKEATFLRHGLLFGLHVLEGRANVPTSIRGAVNQLLKSESCPGLAFVGRPSEDDMAGGWFEVWMLAAASRLPFVGVRTAFFPALTCLQLLKDLGSPNYWDEICDPLLDARLLFIPDFQLDCGPWGHLGPYQFGMLERLLNYRIQNGHQTVVGVQAPDKLSPALKKILLGLFEVRDIPNGAKPQPI